MSIISACRRAGDYLFKSHFASYGFTMAIVRFPESYDYYDFQVTDNPRDILFTLDQIGLESLEGLEGVIDSNNVGVAGYSGEGFDSLALSGVRIDPEDYLEFCEQTVSVQPAQVAAQNLGFQVCKPPDVSQEATGTQEGASRGCGVISTRWSGWWDRESQARIRPPAPPLETVRR